MSAHAPIERKPISSVNLAVGAFMQLVEVTTLGQPFEVVKTTMAGPIIFTLSGLSFLTLFLSSFDNSPQTDEPSAGAGAHLPAGRVQPILHGPDPLGVDRVKHQGRRASPGQFRGWVCSPQRLITPGLAHLQTPTVSIVEYYSQVFGASKSTAGLLGGMLGGVAQAYTTMGFCTFMKTVEVTRAASREHVSTWKIAADVFKKDGIRGLNKGVNAVALRQMTNWGTRFGVARFIESQMRGKDHERKLTTGEKVLCEPSSLFLSCFFSFWSPSFSGCSVGYRRGGFLLEPAY